MEFSNGLALTPWLKEIKVFKVWAEYFKVLESGEKTFEIRSGNHFEPDMALVLDEYLPEEGRKTGRTLVFRVTYAMKISTDSHGMCLPFPPSDEPVWCLGIKRL